MGNVLTSKEIVHRAVHFKTVPRTPVAIIDGGVWMINHYRISFEDILNMPDCGTQMVLDFFKLIDSDIVWVCQGCYSLALRAIGAKVDFSRIGEGVEVIKPMLEDPADVLQYDEKKLAEQLRSDPGIIAMLKQAKAVAAEVGQEKCVAINYIGPFTLASQMIGVSAFMTMLFDEDVDLQPLLDYATKMCYEFYNLFLEAGCDTIFIGDPSSSGDLVSPAVFEQFGLPYIKKLTAMIGQRASVKLLHICGNTKARLSQIKNCGITAFSLDSVDLETALSIADKKYAICGNMSPLAILNDKNENEVEELCTQIANIAGLNGGFVMMPGCDLAPSTPLKNIQAMIRAAHNHKSVF